MVEAYDASINQWKAEIERLSALFLNQRSIGRPALEAIRDQKKAWTMFMASTRKMLRELGSVAQGTMWYVKTREYANDLFRSHALNLAETTEMVIGIEPQL